jgi:hypothetical protein
MAIVSPLNLTSLPMTRNTLFASPRSSALKRALCAFILTLLAGLQAIAAPKETATFIPVGFLPGDDFSYVNAVNDAGTLAACVSYHRDPNTLQRVYTSAARWTSTEGMQPLPLLADTPNAQANPFNLSIGGRDVTNDGSRIVYTSHTTAGNFLAVGIADFDGSNVINITDLPNGDKLTTATQLSDDGATAFGYRLGGVSGFASIGAIWTASGGVSALIPPVGFAETYPAPRAISADGSVSAGILANTNADGVYLDEQAYRWTAAGGVQPLGYLPGGHRSGALALTSNGTKILGYSSTGDDPDGLTANLFLWSMSDGMIDLGIPQYDPNGGSSGGAGLSADGQLILTGAGGYSFIRRADYPYYFNFKDILAQVDFGGAIDGWSSFTVSGISPDGNTVFGQAPNPNGRPEGFIMKFPIDYFRTLVAPLPEITSALAVTTTLNDPFVYVITASGAPESFGAEDLPLGFTLETGTSQPGNLRVGLISGTPTVPGIYTIPISATNVAGTANATLTLTVTYAGFVPRLLNISTRARILTDDKVLIAGFIIPTGGPKKVILRAIGPSLADVGLSGLLDDPVLELHSPDGSVVTNDNWQDSQKDDIEATGYAPSDERESALVATLDPGSYTVIISGKNGATGIGLVEAYDLDEVVVSQMANLSTRGFIDADDNVLIGGITIGSMSNPQIVVRAIGPSLADLGVSGAMADPVLEIHGADGSMLFSNDNWRDSQESDLEASGYAPADDHESAIIATLPPDQYTAIVRGKDDTTGVGLVEVYNLSQ